MKTIRPRPSHGNSLMRLLLASILCILAFATAVAQSVNPQHQAALQAIADHLSHITVDRTTPVLQSVGFDPATVNGWKAMPALRKLETAYLAAEAKNPGRGGTQFIAIMSQHLPKDYEAAKYHPDIQPYLSMQVPEQIEFATPVMKRPPPKATRSILVLADYLDGNAMGGSLGIIRDYLQLAPDQAAEILRTSATDAQAIIRAINYVPEAERKPRLEAVVFDLDRTYEAARHDPDLDVFRPHKYRATPQPVVLSENGPGGVGPTATEPHHSGPPSPPPPVQHGPSGGAPSAGPERFPTVQQVQPEEAVSRYKAYEERVYFGPPAERIQPLRTSVPGSQSAIEGTFETILRGEGGFGGVVFGNSVSAIGLGKPLTMQWVSSNNNAASADAWGRIVVLFQVVRDGQREVISRTYGPVRWEDAYAASKMVFAPEQSIQRSAVGLIGLADPTESFDCTQDEIVNEAVRWRVIMHPALANLKLGWSTLMVDSLPILHKKFEAQLAANADLGQQRQIHDWLSSTPGTWKFYDAPVEIRAIGGRLVLSPSDDRSMSSRHSYLRVKAFGASLFHKDTDFERGFVDLLPVIVEASEDYARLNDFAAVLGLFRWAAKNHVSVAGDIPRPSEYPTAASLIITKNDQFLAAGEFTPGQLRSELRKKVQGCLQTVTSEFSQQAQAVLKGQQDLIERAADELAPAAEIDEKIGNKHARLEFLVNLATSQSSNPRKNLLYAEAYRLDEGQWVEIIRELKPTMSSTAEQLEQAIDDYQESRGSQERKADEILGQLIDKEKLLEQLWASVDGSAKQQHDEVIQEYQAQDKAVQEVRERLYELASALRAQRLGVGRQCASRWTIAEQKRFNELAGSGKYRELDRLLTMRCKGWKEELKQRQGEIVKQSASVSEAEMKLDDAANALDRLDDETFKKLKYWYALTDQLLAIYGGRLD